MSVDTNSELGLKFSSGALPSVAFPSDQDSLVHVNVRTGDVTFLAGYNHLASSVNDSVFDLLKLGLAEIDTGGDGSQVLERMRQLLIHGSDEIRLQFPGQIAAGTNVTVMKFFMNQDGARRCLWSGVGMNRAYFLNVGKLTDLSAMDSIYHRTQAYDAIMTSSDLGLLVGLDNVTSPNDFAKSHHAMLENFWNALSQPPHVHLGSQLGQADVQASIVPFFQWNRMLFASVGVYRSLTRMEIINVLLSGEPDPAQVLVEKASKVSSDKRNFRATQQHGYAAVVVERI